MKNQKGFAAILMVSIVLVMVVTFMGSAAIYFGSLYQDIARQQRAIAAHTVTEDFARMIQQARELWLNKPNPSSACPANTQPDGAGNQLCWPNPTGASPTRHCVRHPLGNLDPTNPRLICRSGPAAPAGASGTIQVVYNIVEPEYRDIPTFIREKMYAFQRDFNIGLDLIASKFQNSALAQTSDMAHMPNLASPSPPFARFTAALNCAPAGAPAEYCKKCPGGPNPNLEQCVEVRICIKPSGVCGANEWITRVVGLISR